MTTMLDRALPNLAVVVAIPETLADLAQAIGRDPDLAADRKRDLISGINSLCAWRGLDAAIVRASHRDVRAHLEDLHWQQLGKSRKTVQNVQSYVSAALNRYVRLEAPMRGKGLAPDWALLWRLLPEGELRYRLSRLIGYCSMRGIPPSAVDDAVGGAFRSWLIDGTLVERPEALFDAAVKAWNKAAATIEGWPTTPLTPPAQRTPYTLKWNELPEAVRRDGEAWIEWNVDPDPLDDEAPLRAWSPNSVPTRRFNLRQIVSALNILGHDIEHFTGLADLVEVETVKAVLRFFHERTGRKTSSQIATLASTFCAIAEHWVEVDDEHLRKLKNIKARLKHRATGLTPKNRRRLMQFADRGNLEAFLRLPQRILMALENKIERKLTITLADALDMQIAVAIEFLLMAPVRRRNLVGLDLDKHFIVSGRGQERSVFIDFPAAIVKNKVDLTFPIPPGSAELLDFYVRRCLPLLNKHGGTWLFPGAEPGKHKSADHFARQFSKSILGLAGLEMNLHLMRHFGAKLYLDRNPGAYEVMRRVLGHTRLSTTVSRYTGLETEAAIRHFDAVILGIRSEILKDAKDDPSK